MTNSEPVNFTLAWRSISFCSPLPVGGEEELPVGGEEELEQLGAVWPIQTQAETIITRPKQLAAVLAVGFFLPQFGHTLALELISFPHSLHFFSAIGVLHRVLPQARYRRAFASQAAGPQ